MTVRDHEEQGDDDLAETAVRTAPPWLISAVFHMVLMIVLGLWMVVYKYDDRVSLEVVYAEQLGEQLEFDTPLVGLSEDVEEEPVLSISELPEVEDPFAAPPELVDIKLEGTTATSEIEAGQIGLALSGRQEGMKKARLGRYGGNATTEAAVQLGLKWLARQQHKEGFWSLEGPYPNGATSENFEAATAMALLAFQGAGNTHQKGPFKRNVARGWEWLLKQQDANGNFFHEGMFNAAFYTQGQCAIAICELYGMSKDPKFLDPAERAIMYCLTSQSPEGGWKYAPRGRSDTSVTGWIVMALQSAKMAGLEVPEDNLRRVSRFLDRVADDYGSRYAYERGKEPTVCMTAEALLCRQYLGWERNDERLINGCNWIFRERNQISFNRNRDVYFWYYATQVAHHMGGEYWKRWNAVMRQVMPEEQIKTGKQAGSWDPVRPTRDQWEAHGGRLYVTCLSIYMLEVYYRHLPIYHKVYSPYLLPSAAEQHGKP